MLPPRIRLAWRRSWRTAIGPRSMSGAPGSFFSAMPVSGPQKSCGRPPKPRHVSGAGRSASYRKASRGFCGTKRALRASLPCRRIPSPGPPPGETTHWTSAAMAKTVGISPSSVLRIWRSHGLQPHRVRQFKLSKDLLFAEKLRDIVGLYLAPPAHALVLSVDEKSQIQALDRTQPGLPLKRARCAAMTHDYKRHGTTTLFAALTSSMEP